MLCCYVYGVTKQTWHETCVHLSYSWPCCGYTNWDMKNNVMCLATSVFPWCLAVGICWGVVSGFVSPAGVYFPTEMFVQIACPNSHWVVWSAVNFKGPTTDRDQRPCIKASCWKLQLKFLHRSENNVIATFVFFHCSSMWAPFQPWNLVLVMN